MAINMKNRVLNIPRVICTIKEKQIKSQKENDTVIYWV